MLQVGNSSAEAGANVDSGDVILDILMDKAEEAVRKQMDGELY